MTATDDRPWTDEEEREFQAMMRADCKPKKAGGLAAQCEPFARIPLRLCAHLVLSDAQWKAFMYLLYSLVLNKRRPLPATAETTGCTSKRIRHEMLKRLEAAGLAEVEWKGHGKAPLVTPTKTVELKKRELGK